MTSEMDIANGVSKLQESGPDDTSAENESTDQNESFGAVAISGQSYPAKLIMGSETSSSAESVDHEEERTETGGSDVVFEGALLNYGSRKCFMLGLFLLCTSPGILNGFHVMVYVFYGHTPRHWCAVPALDNAGWTPEQIRNISSPKPTEWSNCEYYKLNYDELEKMSYEEAMTEVKSQRSLALLSCTEFSYELEDIGTSVVPEWDLVCERLALKATVQTAVSVGKFLGAFAFGIIADRFGRKVSFVTACCIYILAGPIVAFTSLYQVLVAARVCIGIAGLGAFESGYSIVSEICPPKLRSTVGVLYNQSYPVGILGVALIAYYVRDWRNLQLCISMPALFLIFHMWLIPESPRWLYYSGRINRAWDIVGKYGTGSGESPTRHGAGNINVPTSRQTTAELGRRSPDRTFCTQFCNTIRNCSNYLRHKEMRIRLIVCWIVWFFTAMSYYALTINSASLKTDPYIYVALSGIVEATSYMIPVPLLRVFGRRAVATGLLLTASFALLLLLIIPPNMTMWKVAASLLGRLCVSAVFSVIIIHAFELFPTMARNTAVGTSSTMAHAGSVFAPYLVDFFAEYGWFIPSTICGLGLLLAGLLTQTLPETKDIPLYDTLDDLTSRCHRRPEESVSLKNCAACCLCKTHSSTP
ncbi:organic cation transporter protein-like isoform X2 [Athalia rosae]|uniref:organic cation transporter protein-like isoform X2 n=1 Tax=Athalia rosae TaxID=37344 RepID=UPI0020343C7A|nr:organic cation transporter protein-like isoform X2 [Athalia rosae]